MDAIVLCGGVSSRVKELTKGRSPKLLLEIGGVPFIEHVIDTLLMQGIKGIVFAAGIHGDQIADYVDTKLSLPQRRYGYFQVIVEDRKLDTGGAVKCALTNSTILSKNQVSTLIINGDCLTFQPTVERVRHSCLGEDVIFGTRTANDGSFGSITIKGTPLDAVSKRALNPIYVIDSFEEKSNKAQNPIYEIDSFDEKINNEASFISNGWYILHKNLFDNIPDVCSLEYDLLPKWVKERDFYLVETYKGDTVDIGTTERIKSLRI